MAPKKLKSNSKVKRFIKLISVCHKPAELKAILSHAPDTVIKCIADASLNVLSGDIKLNPRQKRVFKPYKPKLINLASKRIPLKKKRQIIQKGGAFPLLAVLPALVSTVIGLFGNRVFGKKDE
jgi:hypothetical protein